MKPLSDSMSGTSNSPRQSSTAVPASKTSSVWTPLRITLDQREGMVTPGNQPAVQAAKADEQFQSQGVVANGKIQYWPNNQHVESLVGMSNPFPNPAMEGPFPRGAATVPLPVPSMAVPQAGTPLLSQGVMPSMEPQVPAAQQAHVSAHDAQFAQLLAHLAKQAASGNVGELLQQVLLAQQIVNQQQAAMSQLQQQLAIAQSMRMQPQLQAPPMQASVASSPYIIPQLPAGPVPQRSAPRAAVVNPSMLSPQQRPPRVMLQQIPVGSVPPLDRSPQSVGHPRHAYPASSSSGAGDGQQQEATLTLFISDKRLLSLSADQRRRYLVNTPHFLCMQHPCYPIMKILTTFAFDLQEGCNLNFNVMSQLFHALKHRAVVDGIGVHLRLVTDNGVDIPFTQSVLELNGCHLQLPAAQKKRAPRCFEEHHLECAVGGHVDVTSGAVEGENTLSFVPSYQILTVAPYNKPRSSTCFLVLSLVEVKSTASMTELVKSGQNTRNWAERLYNENPAIQWQEFRPKKTAGNTEKRTAAKEEPLLSNDDDTLCEGDVVSCLCPVSLVPIECPARGEDCDHLQTFDLGTFLELQSKQGAWHCPICNRPCPYHKLVVDEEQQKLFASPAWSGVEKAIVSADRVWRAFTEKKRSLSRRDTPDGSPTPSKCARTDSGPPTGGSSDLKDSPVTILDDEDGPATETPEESPKTPEESPQTTGQTPKESPQTPEESPQTTRQTPKKSPQTTPPPTHHPTTDGTDRRIAIVGLENVSSGVLRDLADLLSFLVKKRKSIHVA